MALVHGNFKPPVCAVSRGRCSLFPAIRGASLREQRGARSQRPYALHGAALGDAVYGQEGRDQRGDDRDAQHHQPGKRPKYKQGDVCKVRELRVEYGADDVACDHGEEVADGCDDRRFRIEDLEYVCTARTHRAQDADLPFFVGDGHRNKVEQEQHREHGHHDADPQKYGAEHLDCTVDITERFCHSGNEGIEGVVLRKFVRSVHDVRKPCMVGGWQDDGVVSSIR